MANHSLTLHTSVLQHVPPELQWWGGDRRTVQVTASGTLIPYGDCLTSHWLSQRGSSRSSTIPVLYRQESSRNFKVKF